MVTESATTLLLPASLSIISYLILSGPGQVSEVQRKPSFQVNAQVSIVVSTSAHSRRSNRD